MEENVILIQAPLSVINIEDIYSLAYKESGTPLS